MAASEFIQNAVFISLSISNEEQIRRLTIISQLYAEIGYHRKSSFYKRFAALKAVSLNLSNPNWEQCYSLLIPALEGYHLTLDPLEYERRSFVSNRAIGWVGIHLQLMQELITTARRMKLDQVAIRHLSFLLHSLFEFLTPAQRQEFSGQLSALSTKCGEATSIPLTLDNGTVIPTVNLTKFPLLTTFKVENLPASLRPHKLRNKLDIKENSSPSSPFIFTPLQLNRPIRKSSAINIGQIQDFKWVENVPSEVTLNIFNHLSSELAVSEITLITEGVKFEVSPINVVLPPESGPEKMTLTGIPRGHGKLTILGYTTHVLGVKNNCSLKDLPNAKKLKFPTNYCIDVVPALPEISLDCVGLNKLAISTPLTLPEMDYVVSTFNVSLFMGERKTFSVCLTNLSAHDELVECVSVRVISKMKKHDEGRLISQVSGFDSKLPLEKGASISVPIEIFGIGEFVAETIDKPQLALSSLKSGTSSPAHSSSGLGSPVHSKKQPMQLGTALANFLSDLQTPNTVSAMKLNNRNIEANQISSPDTSQDYSSQVCTINMTINH